MGEYGTEKNLLSDMKNLFTPKIKGVGLQEKSVMEGFQQ